MVVDGMKDVYADLIDKEAYVKKVIFNEEQRFIETLDAGLKILSDEARHSRKREKQLSREMSFSNSMTHSASPLI